MPTALILRLGFKAEVASGRTRKSGFPDYSDTSPILMVSYEPIRNEAANPLIAINGDCSRRDNAMDAKRGNDLPQRNISPHRVASTCLELATPDDSGENRIECANLRIMFGALKTIVDLSSALAHDICGKHLQLFDIASKLFHEVFG